MKNYTMKNATIFDIEKLNYSNYGNPRWLVRFSNVTNDLWIGRTASNAQCGYILGYNSVGEKYDITYHVTYCNRIIIDYIKAV